MTGERARSAGFFLTQAFLANMFGMRRATICAAAASLQSRGLPGTGCVFIIDLPQRALASPGSPA